MENQQTMKSTRRHIDCDDVVFQDRILCRHSLFDYEYDERIAWFFGAAGAPPPKPHGNMVELQSELDSRDCNQEKIKLSAMPHTNSNQDIIFEFEDNKEDEYSVNYSLVLFKAVLRVHQPDEIYFSKAMHKNSAGVSRPDVVFKAVREGEAVYYGDLTDLIP